MAIRDLYVPAATENPIKRAFLPRTTPSIQFPLSIRSPEQTRMHAALVLLWMFLCSAACLFYAGTRYKPSPQIVLGLLGIVVATILYRAYREFRYGESLWHYSTYLPLVLLFLLLLRAISPLWLFFVTLALLLIEAFCVNLHYLGWVCAGFYVTT